MNRKILFSSKCDSWSTPLDLFFKLDSIYHFDLDLCASDEWHLCDLYFTKDNSCLNYDFYNYVTFCNPPYSRSMNKFIKKIYEQSLLGAKVVLLVPSRTDTKWFHNYIYNKPNIRIEFIKGRLKFGGCNSSAPFPSMLVYFNL